MTIEVLILLIAFQVKHLIADYYLQFPYMYENKGKSYGWTEPLMDHAGVHGYITLLIVFPYAAYIGLPTLLGGALAAVLVIILGLIDFTTHFAIDRWKATQEGGPNTSGFWTNLGLDQMFHHLVGIYIIYTITTLV